MNFEVKNIYAGLVSIAIVFTVYAVVVAQMYGEGQFEGAAGNALLAKAILAMMLGGVLVHIVVAILTNIVLAIIARDPKPSFVVDERDKLIELRGLRVSYYVFGAGFVAAIIIMALGAEVFWVINLLLAFCALSTVVEAVVRLACYRRGF